MEVEVSSAGTTPGEWVVFPHLAAVFGHHVVLQGEARAARQCRCTAKEEFAGALDRCMCIAAILIYAYLLFLGAAIGAATVTVYFVARHFCRPEAALVCAGVAFLCCAWLVRKRHASAAK